MKDMVVSEVFVFSWRKKGKKKKQQKAREKRVKRVHNKDFVILKLTLVLNLICNT